MAEDFPGDIERVENVTKESGPVVLIVGETAESAAKWARLYLGKGIHWCAVDPTFRPEGLFIIQAFVLREAEDAVSGTFLKTVKDSIALTTGGGTTVDSLLNWRRWKNNEH